MIKLTTALCLLFSQFAMAEGAPLSVDEVKDYLFSKRNFSGEYSLRTEPKAWSAKPAPMDAEFSRQDDGGIRYQYKRKSLAAGETDDGSCNGGIPLPRTLVINEPETGVGTKATSFTGYIRARECKRGNVGPEGKMPVLAIQLSANGKLTIMAVVGQEIFKGKKYGIIGTYVFN